MKKFHVYECSLFFFFVFVFIPQKRLWCCVLSVYNPNNMFGFNDVKKNISMGCENNIPLYVGSITLHADVMVTTIYNDDYCRKCPINALILSTSTITKSIITAGQLSYGLLIGVGLSIMTRKPFTLHANQQKYYFSSKIAFYITFIVIAMVMVPVVMIFNSIWMTLIWATGVES